MTEECPFTVGVRHPDDKKESSTLNVLPHIKETVHWSEVPEILRYALDDRE